MSIKHQVICDETAISGVLKQTDVASGELVETKIKFVDDISNIDYGEEDPPI